jgi:hypothetical protein
VSQKLSEDFIREFKGYVDWYNIYRYQQLSENFIKEFYDKIDWDFINRYQKLPEELRELPLPEKSWMYKTGNYKLNQIKKCKKYKIDGDYVIAYKGIREDRYSAYNFQYKYEVGNTYETHADYNINEENSFGFSAWTKQNAKNYFGELVIKVKIHKDDLAALVHQGNKIRCKKLTVLT